VTSLRFYVAHPALTWITIIWIALCGAGWQNYPSQKSIALLPWVLLVLYGTSGLTSLREIASRYKLATVATVVLAAIILANDALHGFTKTGLRHFTASIVWLPIAALTLTLLRKDHQNVGRLMWAFSFALAIAVSTSVVQLVLLQQDRPTGLNHNVHSGTIALVNLCAIVALCFCTTVSTLNKRDAATSVRICLVAFATICAIFILVLSGARSPLVAVAFTTVFLVALLRQHLRFAGMLSVVIISGLLIVLGYERSLDIAREITAYIAGDHATSLGGRLDAWRWFSEQGLSAPWLGQSPESVTTSLSLRGERWGLGDKNLIEMEHLHNDLLQVTASYGIVAASAFVCIIVGFGSSALKAILADRGRAALPTLAIPLCIVSAVCLVAITGFTDSLTYWSVSWIAWTSAIALMLALQSHNAIAYRANCVIRST
jgi:O-antigen ligase